MRARHIQQTAEYRCGNLKKAIGSRNIKMADPEVVKATTGYVIGSIPAFWLGPDGFRTFIEADLLNEPSSARVRVNGARRS